MTWQWVVLICAAMFMGLLAFGLFLTHRQKVEEIRAAATTSGFKLSGQPFGGSN